MPTRDEIETALDNGRLEVAVTGGRWWTARRNGQTQTWKTRPGHFSIPIKAGFRSCARIDHTDQDSNTFRIV